MCIFIGEQGGGVGVGGGVAISKISKQCFFFQRQNRAILRQFSRRKE